MLKRRFFSYLKSQVQCRQYSPKNNVARKIKTLLHDLTLFFFFGSKISRYSFFGQQSHVILHSAIWSKQIHPNHIDRPRTKTRVRNSRKWLDERFDKKQNAYEMKILNFLFPFYLSLLFYCHPNHILNLMSRGDYIQL